MRISLLLGILICCLFCAKPGFAENILPVGIFSELAFDKRLPDNWEPLTFSKIEKHTVYDRFEDNGLTVIKADSQASASGLIRKIRIDPAQFPIIKWQWKVTGIYQKGDVTKKDGDDYPARIYVAFEYNPENVGFFEKAKFGAIKLAYGEYPPINAINYIWTSKEPKGTVVDNPYTSRVKMIVVESGTQNLNTWISEQRNIYQDYLNAFGRKPPNISGIAIMTDSDNTKESAVSYYGDIVVEAVK